MGSQRRSPQSLALLVRPALLIGVLVGLIGVALGASLMMVLLVALTAAGLTVIIARERG